ncbi:MAG: hypothetical protein QW039_06735 [Fervidicoccaceae archaeon]
MENDCFRVALVISSGRSISHATAAELLQLARRKNFRLKLFIFSDMDPPDQVISALPLISINHSVTLSIITKKLDVELLKNIIASHEIDSLYLERAASGILEAIKTDGSLPIRIFDGEVISSES